MIEVMKYFPGYTLEIAGGGPIREKLDKIVLENSLTNVIFHGMLKPEKLKVINRRAKIGFNLLLGESLNYYYSLANKFFDYVMMEVPVVTMKFPVYVRLMDEYKVGEMIENLDVNELKTAISKILEVEYYDSLCNNCRIARKDWNWDNEIKVLDTIL